MFQPNESVEELFIDKLRRECQRFMEKHGQNYKNEILRLTLPVHMGDLMEKDGALGEMAINNPIQASFVITAFVYNSMIRKLLVPGDFPNENLIVQPRYQLFLGFPDFEVSESNFVGPSQSKRLFTMRGILTSISTPPQDYTQCAQYKCNNIDCPNFMADIKQVRIHIPGAAEQDVANPRFKCLFCGLNLEEDLKLRQLGKKVTSTIISTKHDLSLGYEKLAKHKLTLRIRDELIDDLEIGQKYIVVGLPIIKWKENCHYIEVNNVIPDFPVVHRPTSLSENHIYKMAETLRDTPWAYCLNLAYFFVDQITSPGFLFKVKLGLLLSLVAVDFEEDWKNSSLLVICKDDVKTHRFFEYASKFCSRRISHQNNANLTSSMNKEGRIECGSMELAKDGVCVTRANNLSKNDSETLSRVLISGLHQPKSQLSCRVWSTLELFDKKTNKKNLSDMTNYDGLKLTNPAHKLMSEAFSLVYVVGNPEDDDETCDNEVSHCLIKAMRKRSHEVVIPESDWFPFLETAKTIKTQFTREAKDLLTEYFVAIRNTSPSTSTQSMPVTTMSKLLFVAKGFAKLCLSDKVTRAHAIMSIYVLEEMNTALRGYSSLFLKPAFSFKKDNANHEEMFHIFQRDLRRVLIVKSSQISCYED